VIKLNVIGINPESKHCWGDLYEMLNEGKESGFIDYEVHTYTMYHEPEDIFDCDGIIYLDIDPTVEGVPYAKLEGCEDPCDAIEALLAEIYASKTVMTAIPEVEPVEVVIHPSKKKGIEINLEDAYTITDKDCLKVFFKDIVAECEGKEVIVGPSDFITLGKMCFIMDKLGYKVKQVIV